MPLQSFSRLTAHTTHATTTIFIVVVDVYTRGPRRESGTAARSLARIKLPFKRARRVLLRPDEYL